MSSRPKKSWPFRIEYPPELPISARVDEIVAAIQQHPVVVLAGETGSGKTTQIPKMCLAAGRGELGRIGCTQPRRVAATSISRRVAEELGVPWGREVGCKIRFADQTSGATVIKFMTDGMLLAELQADPELREYDTLIVDEAHERSLNIDFILGHLRRLRLRRPELKVIITSATIDTQAFAEAFGGAPIIEVSGRVYPVEVVWSPLEEMKAEDRDTFTYLDGALEAVGRILDESATGDILVFLPTERDIRELSDVLAGQSKIRSPQSAIEVVPLFGRLTNAEQQRVFASSDRRKVVVATNIAETSLTIPGIRFVVDSGLARVSRYVPQSRTRRLPVEPVAQSSADQRKGRCGRVSDGVCVRLFSEQDFNDRPRFAQPEIQRSNLADVILRMKAFGLGDIEEFPFLNAPPARGIRAGYALLEELGALERSGTGEWGPASGGTALQSREEATENRNRHMALESQATSAAGSQNMGRETHATAFALTELGRELADLPVDPTIGRMLLQARKEKCLRELLVIAAALSIQDPRERPLDQQAKADAAHRRFTHPDSDFLTLLAIWEAYHDEFEAMTLGKLRKFCTAHYLSFMRMREWRDVHAQLLDLFRERPGFRMTSVYDGVPGGSGRDSTVSGHKAPPTPQTPPTSQTPPASQTSPTPRALPTSEARSPNKARPATQTSPTNKTVAARQVSPAQVPEIAFGTPAYAAIHRSILSGLLGNIASRGDDGTYHATHDRKVGIFPGSALAEKAENRQHASRGRVPPAKPKAAQWIMAAEIMETGRVYARTCARIDPQWALELGAHLLRVAHSEPFWNPDAGRVLVKERRRLYNLELETRAVGFGRINPRLATEIFIREGLVGDTITWPFNFLAHNRRLRERIEAVLTRARSAGYMNVDEAMYRFYARRLLPEEEGGTRRPGAFESGQSGAGSALPSGEGAPSPSPGALARSPAGSAAELRRAEEASFHPVSAVPELIDLVRHRQTTEPKFLCMAETDLRLPEDVAHDAADFPEALPLENRALPLQYSYKPGREDDGVTLRLGPAEAAHLTPAALDWAVPGHLVEKVEILLKALPKEQRRGLIPLAESARQLADRLGLLAARRPAPTLAVALAEALTDRLGVRIDPKVWTDNPLPDHLRVRVEVVDAAGQVLGAGRELAELQAQIGAKHRELSRRAATADSSAWQAARAKWETPASSEWKFGDLPDSVVVAEQAGVPVKAYPGLAALPAGTAVRLFATPEEAEAATRGGLRHLFGTLLRHELGWLEKDLRDLRPLGPLAVTLAPLEKLQADAGENLRHWATGREVRPLQAAVFARELAAAKAGLRGVVPRLRDLLQDVLSRRLALQTHKTPYPGLPEDLAQLLPPDFLRRTPFDRLKELPRYLQGRQLRADRWKRDPAKDSGRARELQPFAEAAKRVGDRGCDFRWLVEEFRVSLFAQELGTAEPVSAVRLERALEALAAGSAAAASASARPAPPKAAALPVKGRTVLKSLDALGNLPR